MATLLQILHSDYKPLVTVVLPEYQGRQKYMHSFDLANIVMPAGFEDYSELVHSLCHAAGAEQGTAHMTVDEKQVKAGMSQRRPQPHVDGCFSPSSTGGAWEHGDGGAWLHYCNDIGASSVGRMSVIVAASVAGCRAWKGTFTGRPKSDGDLTHISEQLGEGEVLPANVGYLLSPDCVHESMVFLKDTLRTFLRIALPVDYVYA